jgi:hypothetical protein
MEPKIKLPLQYKILIGAVGVVGAYLLIKKFQVEIKAFINKRKQNENVTDELKDAEKKQPLTYPLSQYDNFANIIETACFDLGTDEQAIYQVFYRLKNNADFLQLAKAWGNPTRRYYEYFVPMDFTLVQMLRYDMSDSECQVVNQILAKKGIKYRV